MAESASRRRLPTFRPEADSLVRLAVLLGSLGPLFACGSDPPPSPFDREDLSEESPMVVQMSAGLLSWCVVDREKDAFCWGRNDDGQLGDGTRTDRNIPTRVTGGLLFGRIGPSSLSHRCGLTDEGRAYCWGGNDEGQLGTGDTEGSLEPVPVSGDHRFTRIGAGLDYTCGLGTGGTIRCWGQNREGQQGTGASGTFTPTPAAGSRTFVSLAVGDEYICALDDAGIGYCTGLNHTGQLGDGTATPRGRTESDPEGHTRELRKIAGGHRFSMLAARFNHTCGITTEGDLYCWGSHQDGQLGPVDSDELESCTIAGGTEVRCATEPLKTPLATRFDVAHVSVGFSSTCIVTEAGQMACWGRGFPNPQPADVPERDEDFVAVHTFGYDEPACGLAESGRIYCGPPAGRFLRPWLEVRFPEG